MMRKIVLAAVLLACLAAAPALATEPYPSPDKTYYANPWTLDGGSGLKLYVTQVVSSDTPIGSYGVNYPPSEYRYYVVYYMMDNPNDQPTPFQYNITFVDTNGTEYRPVDVMTGSRIPAKFRSTAALPVEYAIPRTATIAYLKSYYINNYLNTREWTIVNISAQASPTPSATAAPSATPTPTAAPGPTATPKATPVGGLLPLLAIGIAGGLGVAFARGSLKRK